MMAARQYIDKHGKPVAFYSDKHAVFRVSGAESRRTGTAQFGRALRDGDRIDLCQQQPGKRSRGTGK
jgi:hypothetical protein